MSNSSPSSVARALAAALLLTAGACASDPEEAGGPAVAPGPVDPAPGGGGVSDIRSVEYFNVVVGDRVFFETDRHELDAEAQRVLVRQAQWLSQNPAATAVIEGHADERGTREYNLALGARRANSVRRFLLSQGVAPERLSTVSYGKERPVALGSDPESWAQNRRAVTVVAKTPGS